MARTTAGARQTARNFVTCLNFNGTTDKVVTTLWGSSQIYSMGTWFKSANYKGNGQSIISNGAGGGGRGQALVLSGNAATDGSVFLLDHVIAWIDLGFKVQDRNWHHIFMTTTGSASVTVVYLDGVQKYSSNPVLNTPTTSSSFGSDNTSGFFLGKVDDARYYTAALSSANVVNIFNGVETAGTPANWYKLDEGSGTTAQDSGTAVKNGTITGATYSTDVVTIPRTSSGARTTSGTRIAA